MTSKFHQIKCCVLAAAQKDISESEVIEKIKSILKEPTNTITACPDCGAKLTIETRIINSVHKV